MSLNHRCNARKDEKSAGDSYGTQPIKVEIEDAESSYQRRLFHRTDSLREERIEVWVYCRYDGPNKPAGTWRLENVLKGLTIENRFREEQVKTCFMLTREKDNLVRMEIHSDEHEVKPGDRITINHTL